MFLDSRLDGNKSLQGFSCTLSGENKDAKLAERPSRARSLVSRLRDEGVTLGTTVRAFTGLSVDTRQACSTGDPVSVDGNGGYLRRVARVKPVVVILTA